LFHVKRLPRASFTWNNAAVSSDHQEELLAAARRLGLDLDAQVVDRLDAFARLLETRAVPLGMIGKDDADRIVSRHVLDSLRASRALLELHARTIVDLGSGAGLPGIVVAIASPEVVITLAEVRPKRAAFLELVVERLGVRNAEVHVGPAAGLPPHAFDAATARAFAPPALAWVTARPLLREGGSLVFFAGASESIPAELPGAHPPTRLEPGAQVGSGRPDSWRTSRPTGLASSGDLVIITSK
jgi:16S rRNA (guanine(527)-N(7))-methyltransferase RsmG